MIYINGYLQFIGGARIKPAGLAKWVLHFN